jgi:U4/U6.U5 tri-snRNP-associated protein 1
MAEEVIELSIEETQALRAKLGLAPLRFDNDITNDANNNGISNDKEISLSIEETNSLRHQLGLAPLQLDDKEPIHAPPPADKRLIQQARDRINDARDKRNAEDKLSQWKLEQAEEEGVETALDFAAKLRKGKTVKRSKKAKDVEPSSDYTSSDLQGLHVKHDASSFTAGTTTILTLSDAPLLQIDSTSNKITGLNSTNNELSNVNLMDETNASINLKKKRQIELGAGRAGGYAGFDDDEFDELGGVGLMDYGEQLKLGADGGGGGKTKGFAIGPDGKAQISAETKDKKSDLFKGGAISLESRHGNTTVASDFITEEEMQVGGDGREERAEKERKRQMKVGS